MTKATKRRVARKGANGSAKSDASYFQKAAIKEQPRITDAELREAAEKIGRHYRDLFKDLAET